MQPPPSTAGPLGPGPPGRPPAAAGERRKGNGEGLGGLRGAPPSPLSLLPPDPRTEGERPPPREDPDTGGGALLSRQARLDAACLQSAVQPLQQCPRLGSLRASERGSHWRQASSTGLVAPAPRASTHWEGDTVGKRLQLRLLSDALTGE